MDAFTFFCFLSLFLHIEGSNPDQIDDTPVAVRLRLNAMSSETGSAPPDSIRSSPRPPAGDMWPHHQGKFHQTALNRAAVASGPPSILQTEPVDGPRTTDTIKGDRDGASFLEKLWTEIDAQAGRSTPGAQARLKRSIKVWILWRRQERAARHHAHTPRTGGSIPNPDVQW